uniref:ATP synthase complex subunit 8 n=1 Tax=Ophioplocus japonicus TaxID=35056 RepID=A0A513X0B2_9ECHI|nr:ATP synthase F0 subunit 8 [Ophioplocus japonicus]QDH07338.1 ATP synthase F0 subunit 8 [Ophioplocus japonicus]
MPQLDFTLWLLNLIINWSLLSLVIININNYSSNILPLNTSNNETLNNTTNWPWN